ncbi:hypothetical protein BASA50_010176 [Batrachochytrium salamandrivorans]|uniref:DUF659 domain-containing protein n=1 Tax=Batrachochytrium salamandrivorans TaxID=1357716 RepID=A0ABQ8F216_9FUNG|nr:hypothetical protein BASA50_010176 [Batrachochytrium salamandrivorans]
MKLNACLTLDVWSNIKNEPIVNYMLISDLSTFFMDSVSTGEQSHNAKWIAQDMERMVDFLVGKCSQLQRVGGSLKACFESLRKSEHVLHRIVYAKDFTHGTGRQKESQQKIHDIITDDFLYGDAIGIAYLLDPRFVGKKMAACERTRVEDLILEYGSETEQSQQMGKKKSNVSSVYQFCDQGQSQQESKGFFAS